MLNENENNSPFLSPDNIMDDSQDLKVAIIPSLQEADKQLVQNGNSHKDQKNYVRKSSWSWKDKLKLSRRIWSAPTFESAIDISPSNKNSFSIRYSHPMASSSSVAIIEDEINQGQNNTNITESQPTRISNPSLVTSHGPKRHCCYFFIFFIPIAITVVSLILYNFASLKNFISPPSKYESTDKRSYDPRQECFSMCEPPDILRRHNGKMIKPTIAHNGIRQQQVFLYMYPHEPEFDPEEVGEPVFITPYIQQGKIKEGREQAKVNLHMWPELDSYAGFLTVEEKYNSNIYFWFFPSQSNPASDPVALWLQGGPGATSLYGLLKENGPFLASAIDPRNESERVNMQKKGKEYPFPEFNRVKSVAKLNPYSWNRNMSLLYIDNPVGAGFSFTEDDKGYPNFVNESSRDLYEALQQFFNLFPEYSTNDFFVFGESYGGKYIPDLAYAIHSNKFQPRMIPHENIKINLRGIGIGNGWMSPIDQGKYASFLYYHGMLDGEQYLTLLQLEEELIGMIANEDWYGSWQASDTQLTYILEKLNYSSLYDLTRGQYFPSAMDFWYYLQQPYLRKAANLGNRTFSDGIKTYTAMIHDTMQTVLPQLTEIMENYKVLLYHGSLDIICHYTGAQEMLVKANWTGKDEYHQSRREPFWVYNEETTQYELAGYVKGKGNTKLALIRNAGHSAPMDQPQWTLRLIESFVNESRS